MSGYHRPWPRDFGCQPNNDGDHAPEYDATYMQRVCIRCGWRDNPRLDPLTDQGIANMPEHMNREYWLYIQRLPHDAPFITEAEWAARP